MANPERLARIKAAVDVGSLEAIRNEYQDWLTEEMDKRERLKAEREADRAALARVRAVLEPLLTDPIVLVPMGMGEVGCMCVLCREQGDGGVQHADDCPVLHAAALLGRAGAGTAWEE